MNNNENNNNKNNDKIIIIIKTAVVISLLAYTLFTDNLDYNSEIQKSKRPYRGGNLTFLIEDLIYQPPFSISK